MRIRYRFVSLQGVVCSLLIGFLSIMGWSPVHAMSTTITLEQRDSSTLSEVAVGQPAGDIDLPTIFHGPVAGGKLSSFKGKLVLLDFWALSCSSCLRETPKLVGLQKQFGSKLQVLIVTPNSREEMDSFFIQRPELRIATAIGPSNVYQTLASRFGVPALSTYVWIDGTGIVRGITGSEEVTAANIQAILDGKPIALLPLATHGQKRTLEDKPFMVGGNTGGSNGILARSVLTPYMPGSGGRNSMPEDDGTTVRISFINTVPLTLLNHAMTGVLGRTQEIPGLPFKAEVPAMFHSSRIKLEVADTLALNDYKRSEHLYCYELVLPSHRKQDLYKVMLFEIQHYFGVTASVDTLETPSYALLKVGEGPTPSLGGPRPATKPLTFVHWNASSAALARSMEQRLQIPVFDETGLTIRFDISWDDLQYKSFDGVQAELRKHGLELREVRRKVELLVIRDQGAPVSR